MIGYSTWIGSKNVEIIVASENEKKKKKWGKIP